MRDTYKQWLKLIAEIQAISQSGLTFTENEFDVERYERLTEISAELAASCTDKSVNEINEIFKLEKGYATPKVDVRSFVLKDDKVLLVKNGILRELRSSKIKNKNKFDKKRNELIEIQELIRGIIINNTYQELPYDAAVKINKSTNAKLIYKIDASIFVDKSNQRKILVGSNGDMIKLIGSKSRNLLESKYNKKFYLKLNVCVKKNWKNNYSFLKEIGYIT